MLTSGLVGSILTAFSPSCLMLLHWLYAEPTLVVVVLGCSFLSLCAQFCSSLIYIMASENKDLKGLYTVFGVVFHELFRLLAIHLIFKAEKVFRMHGQVLFSSRVRGINLGCAVGVGFGLTQMVLHFGVLAEAHPILSHDGSTYFDIDICPQMPYLFFLSILSCFHTICCVCWSIAMIQGWFAFARVTWPNRPPPSADSVEKGKGSEAGVVDNQSYGSTGDLNAIELRGKSFKEAVNSSDANETPREAETVGSPNTETNSSSKVSSDTRANKTPSPTVSQPLSPPRGRIPPTTSFRQTEGFVLVILTVILHMVFAFTTLVNSGAYDEDKMETVATRGCVVSLPVAATVTLLSAVLAAGVAKLDTVKREALADL